MSLEIFGRKLREFREGSGLTQAGLAQQFPVAPDLISRWERAYEYKGRRWKPDRPAVLRLIEIFADQLDPWEAQHWANQAGYQLGQSELAKIFPRSSTQAILQSSPLTVKANLKRLQLPPEQPLFGVEQKQAQLRSLLKQAEAPWCIALDGIGGIGKTSLANALVREMMPADRFYDMAWVSAKQEQFLTSRGTQVIERPALDVDTLANGLLEQLVEQSPPTHSTEEKLAILTGLLQRRPYLIVIDNLETVVDYEALLPLLRRFTNPSKVLLTSRHSLHAHSNVYCLTLNELAWSDALDFLQYEAEVRGLTVLASASETQLRGIYQVVGGNPLALKLVVGQIGVLPLSQVLENLREARGQKTDDLYTYIYWQAWHALDQISQHVLCHMPLANGGQLPQLEAISQLKPDQLHRALEKLVALSLVEVGGDDLEDRRYHIHRLTETFLLNEVVKWQAQS